MIDYYSDNENPISMDSLLKDEYDDPNQFNLHEILDYKNQFDSLKYVEQQVVEVSPTEWTVHYELQMNSHFNLSAQLISAGGSPFVIEKDTQILLQHILNNHNTKLASGVFYLEKNTGGIWFKLSYPICQQNGLTLQQFKDYSFELMFNSIKENIKWVLFLSNLLLLTPQVVQEQCERLSQLIDNEYELRNKYSDRLPIQKESIFRGLRQLNEIYIKELCQDKTSVAKYAIKRVNSNVVQEVLIQQYFKPEETANLLQIGDLLSTKVNEKESGYTPFLLVYFYTDMNTVYVSERYICRPSLRIFLHDNNYKLALTRKISILINICNGVYFLHKRQIIHTNINLDSIYIGPNNQATLSCLQFSYCERRPSQHKIMNKPQYIAPEYGSGMKITEKVDIFQIGVLMLQFLFNVTDDELEQRPFIEFESRILKSGLKVISVCIAQILFKCLDHDSNRRPSIGDLIILFQFIEGILKTLYKT